MIAAAISAEDYDAVRLAAHSLKGASANLGALMLAEICEHLEHDCRAGSYDNCEVYQQQIGEEFVIVKVELLKLSDQQLNKCSVRHDNEHFNKSTKRINVKMSVVA